MLEILDFFAADVLLSIFFFVIGLELVDEFRNGELRDIKHASLPALAAMGGVLIPALIYFGIIFISDVSPVFEHGWAIPTATDVAFSLAVIDIVATRARKKGCFNVRAGTKLFLMVLAVADDIIGIVIIAVAFSSGINAFFLLMLVFVLGIWVYLVRSLNFHNWWSWALVCIVAVCAWLCVYFAGIHPTIAGVLLGILVPAKRQDIIEDDVNRPVSRARFWARKLTPFSNKIVVPIFAVISLAVSGYELYYGFSSGSEILSSDVAWIIPMAVTLALVFGKPLGILLFAWIGQHLTPLQLFHRLRVRNLIGTSMLGGIGFTVSFLIAGLSFEGIQDGATITAIARLGVVLGSIISAILGYFVIRLETKRIR
ncbi:MAG: Na+/H+ antiporter NhaA [Candidatus Ancillula sp.]|nr:Na+/H+ antiporter NhaA [Candidatus Ancillula sp.]